MRIFNETNHEIYARSTKIGAKSSADVQLESPIDRVELKDSSGSFFNVVLPTANDLKVYASDKLFSTYKIVFDNDVVFEAGKKYKHLVLFAAVVAIILILYLV